MAKADRLERLDSRRVELEEEYRTALLAALRTTASGTWGLFGHTRDRAAQAKAEPVIAELTDIAAALDGIRERLDLAPFALHQQFLKARGPVKSDAVGEPKQAQAWLERLEAQP